MIKDFDTCEKSFTKSWYFSIIIKKWQKQIDNNKFK